VDMTLFMQLVDKSLIQRVENFRYKIHSVLRVIFVEELNTSDMRDTIRQRLTAYYQTWCQALFRNHPHSPDNLALIEHEHMNIWHLDLMTDAEQQRYVLEILATMHHYWRNRGYSDRVVPILQAAIDNDIHPIDLRVHGKAEFATILITTGQQDTAEGLCEDILALAPDYLYERVRALQHLTRITMRRGDYDTAWEYLEQVVELESQHPDATDPAIKFLFMNNHVGMGWVAIERNDLEIARLHLTLAMQGWTEMDEPLQIAQVRVNLGLLDFREGFYDAAQEHFRAVIPIAEAAQNHIVSLTAMGNLGKCLMLMGNYTEACDYLIKSTRLAQNLKAKTSVLYQLETFAHMAILMETYTIAAQLYGYLLEGSERENVAFSPPTVIRMDEYTETMRDKLGERFESLVAAGRKMPESLAMTLAESLTTYAARIEQLPS
ncbi:MAG: tetratricopeptide repeat protein, partial [Aggregatilineales bacterium]